MVETRDQHLTSDDLAHRQQVSTYTVDKWASRKTGPRYIKVGKHRRYRLADVIAWEDSRASEAPADLRRSA